MKVRVQSWMPLFGGMGGHAEAHELCRVAPMLFLPEVGTNP